MRKIAKKKNMNQQCKALDFNLLTFFQLCEARDQGRNLKKKKNTLEDPICFVLFFFFMYVREQLPVRYLTLFPVMVIEDTRLGLHFSSPSAFF